MAAPFSEPREWAGCVYCRSGDWNRAGEENPFAPCPECGQPPRCTFKRGRPDRCPRPATVAWGGEPEICGQHDRSFDLGADWDEFDLARGHLKHICGLARSFGNYALEEAMDLAWAHVEMRMAGIERERAAIWGHDRGTD